MNDKREKLIGEGLKNIAKKFAPEMITYANVTAVNEGEKTCDVLTDDEVIYTGVLLQSEAGAAIDVLFVPVVNSRVIIAKLYECPDWVVLRFGAIAKLQINCTQIIFNGGSLNGLVTRDGTKGQLNKLENDVNALKNVFTSWVAVPNDGGAALKVAASAWAGTALVNTVDNDIENTAIKQ